MYAADNSPSAQKHAAEYFGLSQLESNDLFLMHWPYAVCGLGLADGRQAARETFDKLKPARRKRVMLKVLDHIIEHGFTWIDATNRSGRVSRYRKPIQ